MDVKGQWRPIWGVPDDDLAHNGNMAHDDDLAHNDNMDAMTMWTQ